MSSDPVASDARDAAGGRRGRRQGRRAGRFRRSLAIAIATLVVLVGVLAVLGAVAPPRLTGSTINAAAATERPGQRLAMTLSQPVAVEGAALTVTPRADAELVIDGTTATVRFSGMLDYATDYTVRIEGLRGTATGATGAVETSFSTPDPGAVTLLRGVDGEPDRVVRSPIDGAEAQTIAEADSITGLAVAGSPGAGDQAAVAGQAGTAQTVAVSFDDGDGAHVRILVPGAAPVDAHGPYEASIRALRGTEAGLFGWIISRGVDGEREYVNTLVVYDLGGESAATNVPVEITGPGGAPLLAVDWAWVPGSTSIVVQDQDGFTWLADSTGREPTLLGTQGTLRDFVPGTTMVLTEDGPDLLLTDLATGESSPFGLRRPAADPDVVPGESAVIAVDAAAWIVHRLDRTRTPSLVGSSIVRTDERGDTVLFETPGESSIILDLCVSPNGQFIAATVAATASADAGATAAAAPRPTTVLIDARTGGTSRSVPGESITWCG